eukprot:6193884-Pleurochrysis_carterae.AAC.3
MDDAHDADLHRHVSHSFLLLYMSNMPASFVVAEPAKSKNCCTHHAAMLAAQMVYPLDASRHDVVCLNALTSVQGQQIWWLGALVNCHIVTGHVDSLKRHADCQLATHSESPES